MNIQFEAVFKIFVDIYGVPPWEAKPKEGQNREEIISLWCDELKGYTIDQVKRAAYSVAKFKKSSSFPTISHLMAELVNEKREACSAPEAVYRELLASKFETDKTNDEKRRICQEAIYATHGICVDGYIPPAKKADEETDAEADSARWREQEKFLRSMGYAGITGLVRCGLGEYRKVIGQFRDYYAAEFGGRVT